MSSKYHKYATYSPGVLDDIRAFVDGGPSNLSGIVKTVSEIYLPEIWKNLNMDAQVPIIQMHYLIAFSRLLEHLNSMLELYWYYNTEVASKQDNGEVRYVQCDYPPCITFIRAMVELVFSAEAHILHNPLIILPASQVRQLCGMPMPKTEWDLYSSAYDIIKE